MDLTHKTNMPSINLQSRKFNLVIQVQNNDQDIFGDTMRGGGRQRNGRRGRIKAKRIHHQPYGSYGIGSGKDGASGRLL